LSFFVNRNYSRKFNILGVILADKGFPTSETDILERVENVRPENEQNFMSSLVVAG